MSLRVRLHADFRADLRAHVRWLEANRPIEAIESLRVGIEEAIDLLGAHPGVGVVQVREGTVAIRKLILRKLPYVIWFAVDNKRPRADLWILRLFHVRQDRPVPRP